MACKRSLPFPDGLVWSKGGEGLVIWSVLALSLTHCKAHIPNPRPVNTPKRPLEHVRNSALTLHLQPWVWFGSPANL